MVYKYIYIYLHLVDSYGKRGQIHQSHGSYGIGNKETSGATKEGNGVLEQCQESIPEFVYIYDIYETSNPYTPMKFNMESENRFIIFMFHVNILGA